VRQILAMVHEGIDGYDADGEIAWVEGEGGLPTAKAHMAYRMPGENMM